MPKYKVPAPNGKDYVVDVPAGTDEYGVKEAAYKLYEQDELARLQDEYGPGTGELFGRGIKRGFKQLGSTLGDVIPAMAGSALGFEDYAKQQMGEAAQTQEEIARDMPAKYSSYKQIKGLGSGIGYAAETIGEQIPNILTSLIPGVGIEAVAGRAALGKVATGLAAQAAERGLVGDAAEQFVAQGVKAAAPEILATRQTAQNVGTYLGAYAQNAPEVFQNIYDQTGELSPAVGLIAGAGAAALDSVLPARLLKNMTGPMKVGIVENLLAKSGMDHGVLRKTASELLTGIGAEGLTEGAQEAISIAAEDFVKKNKNIFDSMDWDRIMESSIRGAIAGGAFGAVGGVTEGAREGAERKQEYQAALDKRRGQLAQRADRDFESELTAMQGAGPQMNLPGVEPPPVASTIVPPTETEPKKKGRQPKAPTQFDMFTDTGGITPQVQKASEQDTKRGEAAARDQARKEAKELKEAQDRIKKAFDEVAPKQVDIWKNVIQPTALERTIAQARSEAEALGGKKPTAPKAPTTPAPTVATEPAVTPPAETVSAAPSTVITDSTLKDLGIGHTALLRKNKILEGKDISNPKDAALVKQVLEAYAENRSEPIRNKVEGYLKRPEFMPSEEVANVPEPRGDVAGTTESGNAVVEPAAGESGAATAVSEAPVTSPVGDAGATTSFINEGEGDVSGALAPDVEAAPAAAESEGTVPTEEIAPTEQEEVDEDLNTLDEKVNKRIDTYFQDRYRTLARNMGIPGRNIEVPVLGVHRGTNAHNLLKLPSLINIYLKYRSIADMETKPLPRAKAIKKAEDAVAAMDKLDIGDATQFALQLRKMSDEQINKLVTNINKRAIEEFDATVKELLDENMAKHQESKTLVEEFPERTWFAPKYEGAMLSDAGAKIVASGNVRDTIDHLLKSANPIVAHVLRRINSLGLKTKLKIGKVEGNAPGSYDQATDTITINSDTGLNEHTLVHELAHAAISHVLDKPYHPLTKDFTKFFDQVQKYLGNAYGAQNLQEFAAELVSNPEFQSVLKAIKAPRSESLFKRIMQSIAEFFGFGKSAFDTGLEFVNDALDVSSDVEPSAANKLFLGIGGIKSLGDVGREMPAMTKNATEKAKNVYSNLKGGQLAKAAFGMLRLDNLNTMYGKTLTSIQPLIDAIELRMGMQDRMRHESKLRVDEFNKVKRNNTQAFARMSKMAIEARLAGVDLVDPSFKPPESDKAEYARLKAVYNSLPEDVRKSYETMRKDYDRTFMQYKQFLIDQLGDTPALREKIKAEFEARTMVKGYVPFMRFGDYWVEYPDPKTGERVAEAFESVRERDEFIKQSLSKLKPNEIKTYKNIKDINYSPANVPPTTFVGKIMASMKQKGASQEMLNDVYQSYLLLFPGESIMKQMVKSKDVLGMSEDLIRGYDSLMGRWATKFANSKYNPDIVNAINEIKEQGKASSDSGVTAAAENILAQREFFLNPTNGTLTRTLTGLSYFEYIAGNISSALVNLTSLPMLVWPMLGGTHGMANASAAMAAASKTATSDWGKAGSKYSALFTAMNDHGQLQHTTANDILEDTDNVYTKFMKAISIPFSASERYNRAVTAIAAYDLAMSEGINGKKLSQQEAIKYAIKVTKDAHTSGMGATAPRWMQQGIGRVFFTFKAYTWNSAFVIARAFHQAFKGETEAVRKAAQKQLLGTYAMTMAFAGAKGLPFMGAASTLATMIQSLFGDDDEPYDFMEDGRDFFGELGWKGAFNYLTNLEVANRTGVATDLIFRDDPRGVAEHGYALSAMQQMFGPAGTYAVNFERAIKSWNDGHWDRAIEAMAPSWARNGLKGARYMSEGATTLKGDAIDSDISAWNMAMQALGFAPADLSSTYENIQAAKSYEKGVMQRRTKLMNLYEMAQFAGDSDLMQETQDKISEFNSKVPSKIKITAETKRRSIAARKAAEKDLIHGMRFNKSLKADIEEKFFSEDEED